MTTGLLLVQALNGLQFGVLLFLVAAGLTLVFGVLKLVNFAHGEFLTFGAYMAVLGRGVLDLHFVAAIVLGVVVAAALALVGTLAASPVAGWLGVAALVAALAVYVQWRRAVRRRRLTGE